MSHNIADELGVSSVMLSLYFNTMALLNMELIHSGYTIVLSTLSVVYISFKIRNEVKKGKQIDKGNNKHL